MNKKQFFFIICIFLITFLFPINSYAQKAQVLTDYLNVRTGPGTTYDQFDQVHSGEIYPLIKQEQDWVKIQLDGDSGWVTKEYISIVEEEKDSINQEKRSEPNSSGSFNKTEKIVTTKHEQTQMRSSPSIQSDIASFADKGTKLEVVAENNQWFEVKLKNKTVYVFKTLLENRQLNAANLMNKKIVIDPGHGGYDVGAISASGIYEKDMTYNTAIALAKQLEMLGANVYLTRTNDTYISLASRASLTNFHQADVFISLHYNSFPELPDVEGIGTYYYHEQYQALASMVQREIIKETDATDRQIAAEDFQVLRQNLSPAILIELGFISNSDKEQLNLIHPYKQKLVTGIISGLSQYFDHN